MGSRRTSVLTLVVAAVAVSTAAVGTIAVPADAAVAGSSVSIRVPHSRIQAGDSTRVLGHLHVRGGQDSSGRTVTLEAKPKGATGFSPVGTAVTGPHGGLSLDVAPSTTTRYQWFYPGAADVQAAMSGIERVVVVAHRPHHPHAHLAATRLSITVDRRVVSKDGGALVRGRLHLSGGGPANHVIDLVSRTKASSTWQVVAQALTDRKGVVSFPVHPAGPTTYRLVFEGTSSLRSSHSGSVRIGVRPDVTAAATPGFASPGQAATISGVVTLLGQPLSGATVDLVARPVGHRQPRHVVGTTTSNPDGSVAITDTPTQSMVYRFKVRPSPGVPGALSRWVLVKVANASSLSIRGREVRSGFQVSGVLRAHHRVVRKAQIELQTLASDGVTWTPVTTGLTDRHGKAEFLEPISEGASYRLSYAGGTRLTSCVSGTVVN